MKLYSTVMGRGEAEQTIERSRFIAHVAPCESREEAEEFFDAIRRQYRDATHNVPAMVLGEKQQVQWASDDGEPQGTSGAPMVQLMVKQGITNTAIIVTRYFGGIKLGTGGLVRAYSQAVKEGLAHCRIGMKRPGCELEIQTDYNGIGKILYLLGQRGLEPTESIYTDTVTLHILIPAEDEEQMRKEITEATFGKAGIEKKRELFYIEKM